MSRPLRVPVAVLVVTAALAGCGGGGTESNADAVRQVRATLQRFTAAVARGDYALICNRLFDPALVNRINTVGLTCPAALRRGFGATRKPQLTVRRVRVNGDHARADVRATAANQPAADATLQLVRVRGQWRVTSLGSAQQPPQRPPGIPTTPGTGPGGGGD